MISLIALNRRFSPPNTTSVSLMSVVKPVRQIFEPDDLAPRLSQELPSQAIGPWTRWATSVKGCSAILAPSKAQPPAAPPGSSCLVQPFLRSASDLFAFLAQPGSLKTPWMVADSELIRLSYLQNGGLPEHGRRQELRRKLGRRAAPTRRPGTRPGQRRCMQLRFRPQRMMSKLKSVFAGTIVFLSISSKILSRIVTSTFMPP